MKLCKWVTLSSLAIAVFSAQAAKYQLVELPTSSLGANTFAQTIDEQGNVVVSVASPFNAPIDYSLIDFDNETIQANLTDVEAARSGNPNDEDYIWLVTNVVRPGLNSSFAQQLQPFVSYVTDGVQVEYIAGFDQVNNELGGFTWSTATSVKDSLSGDFIVGTSTAPFFNVDYTDQNDNELTYVVREHARRGFVQVNGETKPLLAVENLIGGRSEANAINQGLAVAGGSTVEFTDALIDLAAECESDEDRGDRPIEACYDNLQDSLTSSSERRATIWQLDQFGNVIDTKVYPLLFTPEEDDTRRYVSSAVDINDNGVAIGSSNYLKNDFPYEAAVVFRDDTVTAMVDTEEETSSRGVAINNNNLATGVVGRTIVGQSRTKFFIHDVDSGETVFPDDFFPGSASVGLAINDNNIVVGTGEVDARLVPSSERRSEAFIYYHNEQLFQNLNDLLPCDSPFTLIQARGINNSNEIAADAIITRNQKDPLGNDVLDADGNPIPVTTVVAVKLIPTGGEIDDCGEEEELLERQAGSTGLGFLATILLGLVARRRLQGK
ncbi:DUF3466 family protein [Aestuariibacter salexigens]|uniref:DUF3466 family protein n=1 Tax=Aestuariibacter salexigens TaxID=226010 RepID=UPI0004053514|nr:DUF3466 family protein [Aestuariibacter salexigens]